MTTFRKLFIALCLLAAHITSAAAHSQSYGYLSFDSGSSEGSFELAIRDLDRLLPLDANTDGRITWGDIRIQEKEIAQQVLALIKIGNESSTCLLTSAPLMIGEHGGETYLVAPFTANCAKAGSATMITYDALFDINSQHRALVSVSSGDSTKSFVMTPDTRRIAIGAQAESLVTSAATFFVHGVHHLLAGYDHMLFLLTLLLATTMQNRTRSIRSGLIDAAKVVTAFTLAHSVTLGLAATGLVSIPVLLTESLIAITIALAALNNIWPVITGRIWMVVAAFGLIHGLGFANVLSDMNLPQSGLLTALVAFNLGVEAGQLLVVAIALPLLYLFVQKQSARAAIPIANVIITGLGAAWFLDRATGTSLMPF
jgi:hypothetical protein